MYNGQTINRETGKKGRGDRGGRGGERKGHYNNNINILILKYIATVFLKIPLFCLFGGLISVDSFVP